MASIPNKLVIEAELNLDAFEARVTEAKRQLLELEGLAQRVAAASPAPAPPSPAPVTNVTNHFTVSCDHDPSTIARNVSSAFQRKPGFYWVRVRDCQHPRLEVAEWSAIGAWVRPGNSGPYRAALVEVLAGPLEPPER
ncbi:MAG TPA: hypothetical protein VGI39_39765 [Polyangiaceae bacterium]|jgi:hypothetical protein